MENAIQISKINDFVFCPRSLYFHSLYENYSEKIYHKTPQVVGKIKHQNIDYKKYTTSAHIWQGLEIYSEKYNLIGKLDIYDTKKHYIIERKYKVKKIYDGYRYQLYAQYFCLKEMGYKVEKMFIHSLSDNKRYEINLPDSSNEQLFVKIIDQIKQFNILSDKNKYNKNKCDNCIYNELCK